MYAVSAVLDRNSALFANVETVMADHGVSSVAFGGLRIERGGATPTESAANPDLDAIEARANAATPGPWTDCAELNSETGAIYARGEEWRIVATVDQRERNVPFIVHAREDVPALVAEVRSLRAAIERVKALCDSATETFGEEYGDAELGVYVSAVRKALSGQDGAV